MSAGARAAGCCQALCCARCWRARLARCDRPLDPRTHLHQAMQRTGTACPTRLPAAPRSLLTPVCAALPPLPPTHPNECSSTWTKLSSARSGAWRRGAPSWWTSWCRRCTCWASRTRKMCVGRAAAAACTRRCAAPAWLAGGAGAGWWRGGLLAAASKNLVLHACTSRSPRHCTRARSPPLQEDPVSVMTGRSLRELSELKVDIEAFQVG